jgi:pSer/pThr/pTyr-binding forkhead associated (FHA) protein
MTALLHQLGGGRQIPVDRAVVLIGRSVECDAVIDFSAKISRMHCAVVQVNSEYYLRDLGSMNGVWVGGQRIVRELRLVSGMEISIGDVRFLFLENVASPAPVVVPAVSSAPARDSSAKTVQQGSSSEPGGHSSMPRIAVEEDAGTLMHAEPDDDIPILDEVDLEVIEDS